MVRLSVNVNKVATVRNSRGGTVPSVLEAVRVCVAAGAPGITVHPRADARHITPADVHEVSAWLRTLNGRVEFNIEGDPRPDLLAMVHEVKPTQCTLVPVQPGEITSQAGWSPDTPRDEMAAVVRRAAEPTASASACSWIRRTRRFAGRRQSAPTASSSTPSRSPAHTSAAMPRAAPRSRCMRAPRELAASLGLGVNAGHDLDLENLVLFRRLPHLDEVSIGHALVSHALFVGLDRSVRDYLDALAVN